MNWPAFFASCGTAGVVWWVRYYGGPWGLSMWKTRRHAGETAEIPEEHDTQPRTSEREPLSDDDIIAIIAATREAPVADHFTEWEAECAADDGIRKYVRRMDRRSL